MADPTESALTLIPDVYYDLIARVVPGTTCLAALTFMSLKPSPIREAFDVFGFWFLVFGGYVLGLLLTGASALVFDLILVYAVGRWRKDWAKAIGGIEHYNALDTVSKRNAEVGRRLWKMAAEKVCFENGIVGVVLFVSVHCRRIDHPSLVAMLVVGLVLAWSLRAISLNERIEQLW